MMKISYLVISIVLVATFFYTPILAATYSQPCQSSNDCPADSLCQEYPGNNFLCSPPFDPRKPASAFGKIPIPSPIADLGIGSKGISTFLNNVIILIYMIAGIIFVFMILWSGVQWILSGGDDEAVKSARNRIMYAIIGIVVLSITFAIAELIGIFTGFKFF